MGRRLFAIFVCFALLCSCAPPAAPTTEPTPGTVLSADPTASPAAEQPSYCDERVEQLVETLRVNCTVAGEPLGGEYLEVVDPDGRLHSEGVFAATLRGGAPDFYVAAAEDFAPQFAVEPTEVRASFIEVTVSGATKSTLAADVSKPGKYIWYADVKYDLGDGYSGLVTHRANVTVLGEAELSLSTDTLAQGDMLAVSASGALALEKTVDVVDERVGDYPKYLPAHYNDYDFTLYVPSNDQTIDCVFVDGSKLYAVVPIGVGATPGSYMLELRRSTGGAEPETIATANYTVAAREFDRQDLVTSSATQAIYTQDNLDSDNAKLRAARSNSHPTPCFDGLFASPLPEGYVITTEFGEQRYVNDRLQSRHCAYDMAIRADTDVYATARGVVTMADTLNVNGNTVVIDHGAGIFSSYSHLNSISVEVGDVVEQGTLIGLVGSTGYSTGPHLHFQLVVNGYYVDPFYPQQHDLLAVTRPLEE